MFVELDKEKRANNYHNRYIKLFYASHRTISKLNEISLNNDSWGLQVAMISDGSLNINNEPAKGSSKYRSMR